MVMSSSAVSAASPNEPYSAGIKYPIRTPFWSA
jgi:hypothetical protein